MCFSQWKAFTHLCLASIKWDIGKQFRPRSSIKDKLKKEKVH